MERIEILQFEASRLHLREARPLVTLSYAQSLDGSIAHHRGQPLAISGSEAWRFTHQLRAVHDAILVGIGTVLADNPRLTARAVEGLQPLPVVLDSHLRTPPDAEVMKHPKAPWIACLAPPDHHKEVILKARGAQVVSLPRCADSGVDLRALLTYLGGAGIRSLMVEGGAKVITAFLKENLVDQLVLTLAPRLVGGLNALEQPINLPPLHDVIVEPCGQDWILWGKLK